MAGENHQKRSGASTPSLLRKVLNPIWWITIFLHSIRVTIKALVPQLESPSSGNVVGRHSSPSAFLDGLRGVAAFIVLIHHFSKDPFPWLPWGWGSKRNDVLQYHILQLPIVRIVHSGPPMVAVFFVISGFALALSPLKHIRKRDSASLATTLSSSVFRRGMRLYLPCVVTTLYMVFAMQLGLAPFPAHRKPEANIFAELYTWALSMWKLLNPFDLSFTLPRYDDNLWTIPAELRGSMVLFLTLIGVSNLRYKARLLIESCITLWFFTYGLWDVGLFTAGMALAELHLEREEKFTNALPAPSASSKGPSSQRRRLLLPLLFLVSLHLASAPLLGYAKSPSYMFLSSLVPSTWTSRSVTDRWIPALGAPLLVYCADRSQRFRHVLTSPLGRYLGRISFGMYLVHGPIRYTAYHPLLEMIMRGWGLKVVPVGEEAERKGGWLKAVTWIPAMADRARNKAEQAKIHQEEVEALDWRFLAAVALTWAILAPITLGVADWFSRTVDRGSVRFAKRVETKWIKASFNPGGAAEQTSAHRRARSSSRRREADKEWETSHGSMPEGAV